MGLQGVFQFRVRPKRRRPGDVVRSKPRGALQSHLSAAYSVGFQGYLMDSIDIRPSGFNRWLHAQLQARQFSQHELARRSGVDPSTVSRLLRGSMPSLRTAAQIATVLGVPEQGLHDSTASRTVSHAAGVEYALRLDEALDEPGVREVMDAYLAAVRQRRKTIAGQVDAARGVPIPVVTRGARGSSRPGGGIC